MLAVLLLTLALTPPDAVVRAVAEPDGWVDVGSDTRDGVGPIHARHKALDGVDCLEASTVTTQPPALLREIILDIPGNLQWSSADLKRSIVLDDRDGRIDYVQVLGMPPPFSDRYWFLRGQVVEGTDGPGSWSFSWARIDGAALYPAQSAALKDDFNDPVEITLNVGSWALLPHAEGTVARFRSCSDAGGAVPRWAGEKAARMMLPNNVVDLVKEAERRGAL
ncbi:MAG: hypothetical protein H6739_36965 [Alphaproteobacteria bacterium]|nr:hypothetical protein [Alphaproteobacteria bacterium]